jgi:hypothetical protein
MSNIHLYGSDEQKNKVSAYHDLNKFFGTWSPEEAKIFANNLSDFEKIDGDLWKS